MNTTNLLGPMPVDAKAFAEGLNKVVAAGSAYPLGFSGKGLVMRLRMCAVDECHDDEWLSAVMNQAADEIERLERENAELRKDKARLDWLDHNAIPWRWMSPERIDKLGPIVVTWKGNSELRSAIDAAMEAGK